MNVEEVCAYCLAKKGVEESFPFGETTMVIKVMGKIFALVPLDVDVQTINLKCDPERAIELIPLPSTSPANAAAPLPARRAAWERGLVLQDAGSSRRTPIPATT